MAQNTSPNCGTTIGGELFEAYKTDVVAVEAFSENQPEMTGGQVPINFIVIQKDDGSGLDIEQAELDDILNTLDVTFAPSNLDFFQCGGVTYVNDTRIYNGSFVNESLAEFVYSSSAVNIFLRPFGASIARFPCFADIATFDPSLCYDLDNNIWISGTDGGQSLWRNMRHEMGHHLGLFHTFSPEVVYQYPVQAGQVDHPYGAPIGKAGRELAIRQEQPVGTVDFRFPNCAAAGDLVCDTPVDCIANPTASTIFPDVTDPDCVGPNPWGPDCDQGCFISFPNCLVEGNYADYNLHSVVGQPQGTPGRNIMSYHPRDCRTELTPGQRIRNEFYYENYRKLQYDPVLCGNLVDEVDFWDTDKGVEKVKIQYTHASDDRICNTFNNTNGDFFGTLHDGNLYSDVTKLGSNPDYTYLRTDWTEEVDVLDLILISRHLIGLDLFDSGYEKLAADTDRNGLLNTFDIINAQRLLLGIDNSFVYYDQPWIFVPEYIPHNHSTAFHANPFSMLLNGVQYQNEVPYISPNWEYAISDGNNGSSGFDALKLGDVGGSAEPGFTIPGNCEKNVSFQTPSFFFPADDTITLEVKAYGFTDIAGFQGGIALDFDTYELVDIVSVNLPNFNQASNFGTTQLFNSELHMLWFDGATPLSLTNGTSLFKMVLKTKIGSNLNSTLAKADDILKNRFYDSNGCQVEVSLEFSPTMGDTRGGKISPLSFSPSQFNCFPNPAKSELMITIDAEEASSFGQLRILDVNGKTLFSKDVQNIEGRNIHYLDIHRFSAGLYWVTFTDKNHSQSLKLVKY